MNIDENQINSKEIKGNQKFKKKSDEIEGNRKKSKQIKVN